MPLVKKLLRRTSLSLRFRLGLRVAAPELEYGDDQEVSKFYSARVTDCDFLGDPDHYEYPRAQWIVDQVEGGSLLEIGCGNGGMTRYSRTRRDVRRPPERPLGGRQPHPLAASECSRCPREECRR